MPVTKPISALRNKANELSELAHSKDEPIFITKDGEGDLVLMSLEHYSKLQLELDLMSKLAAAQAERTDKGRGRLFSDVMKDLRKRIRESS